MASLADTMLDPAREHVVSDVLGIVADFMRHDVWQRPHRPDKGAAEISITSAFQTFETDDDDPPEHFLLVDNRRGDLHYRMSVRVANRQCEVILSVGLQDACTLFFDDRGVRCSHGTINGLADEEVEHLFAWIKTANPQMVTTTYDDLQPAEFLRELRALGRVCKQIGLKNTSPVYDAIEAFTRKWHRIIFAPLYAPRD